MKISTKWLAGALLFSATVAQAEVRYQLTDLGTLGGKNSFDNSINNLGQVVGQANLADGSSHAFLYSGGPLVDLRTLGGTSSTAAAINDHSVIVGSASTAGNLT
jgi:probable HAF family extracellular repeat protein